MKTDTDGEYLFQNNKILNFCKMCGGKCEAGAPL